MIDISNAPLTALSWAQANRLRGNTETENHLLRRVEFDLDYIRRWSLWLDLLLLLKTP